MSVIMSTCVWMLIDAKEGIGAPEAGVIGRCEPFEVGARSELWFSGRAALLLTADPSLQPPDEHSLGLVP